MKWTDHIIPDHGAGTRPVLKRTRGPVEEVFASLGMGATVADLELSSDELRACFLYVSELIPDRMMQRADAGASKTHVTSRQLEKAFQRHAQTARAGTTSGGLDKNDSYLLMMIYAIECGIKRILLTKRGKMSTHQLDRDDLTHDLDSLLKLIGQPPRFHGINLEEPSVKTSSDRAHEALRYGRRLAPDSRKKIQAAAEAVATWIEEQP